MSKKKAAVLMLVGTLVLALAVGGATYAYFSSNVTSSGNVIQSGTIELTTRRIDLPVNGPLFYKDDTPEGIRGTGYWVPGKQVMRQLVIKNDGSLPARMISVGANLVGNEYGDEVNEMFMDNMIISVAAAPLARSGGSSMDELYSQLSNAQNDIDTWMAANPTATTDEIIAKMEQIYNNRIKGVYTTIGSATWFIKDVSLASLVQGAVGKNHKTYVEPYIGAKDEEVDTQYGKKSNDIRVLFYIATLRENHQDQNILQGKEFEFDFVNNFVQADYMPQN